MFVAISWFLISQVGRFKLTGKRYENIHSIHQQNVYFSLTIVWEASWNLNKVSKEASHFGQSLSMKSQKLQDFNLDNIDKNPE